MIFCVAPVISWALVFSDPAVDQAGMQPVSWQCFTKETDCVTASYAANNAFKLDMSRHAASCQPQPAGDGHSLYPFSTQSK